MLFQIEEKSIIHWETKLIELSNKDIMFYKVDKTDPRNENEKKPFEIISYSKIELDPLEGNQFSIINSKKNRLFRMESKDMKDVIYTKLKMLQDQFFDKSALSENYLKTKKVVEKEQASIISPIEKITKNFMTLFPLLFNDLNSLLNRLHIMVSTKKNQRELYMNMYHSLRGLVLELKSNSDTVYNDLMKIIIEVEKNELAKKDVDLLSKKSDLFVIEDEEPWSRRDSLSMKFFSNEPKPKTFSLMKSFDRLEIQSVEQQTEIRQIRSQSLSVHNENKKNLISYSHVRGQSHFQIEVRGRDSGQKEKQYSIEQEVLSHHNKSTASNSINCRMDENKYINPNYNFIKRNQYSHHIRLHQNFISETFHALMNKQSSLPIYLNEPITTLQRQCERMINSSYLKNADLSSAKDIRLCNIAAFIFGELSLDLNRLMKPIPSLKGETYEYYDNDLHYRFFAEEVSSHPPISAFLGESANFILSGDTKHSTSFNVSQSSFETKYMTPITIKLVQSNEVFKYSLPLRILKSQSLLTLCVEYHGSVKITNENNSNDYCTINISDKRIDGKIFIDNKLSHLLTGSLDNAIQVQDVLSKEYYILWKLAKKEKYLKNRIGRKHYYMPSHSYNLNNSNQQLLDSLPKTDSRHRMDIKEYERGNCKLAQENKSEIELNHIRNEFNNHNNSSYFSLESNKTYTFNGNYWNNK